MKNIKIDLSVYLLGILYLVSGYYKRVILLILILGIHELGHLFWMHYFHVEVLSIKFYPFGGIIKTNQLVNTPLVTDFLISIGGLLNQFILGILFYSLYKYSLINTYTWNTFQILNITLLGINSLPIYPLDGYHILNTLLNRKFSFYQSESMSIGISLLSIIFLLGYGTKKLNLYVLIIFFFIKLYQYKKELPWKKNKFLLERKEYGIPYKRILYGSKYHPSKLKKDTYHYFDYIPERKYLEKVFDKENRF